MEKVSHTPGPFEATYSRIVTVEGPARPVVNPDGYPIAFVPDWEDAPDEAKANAHLIAAAPELLDAAEWLVDQLGRFGAVTIDSGKTKTKLKAIRAAIAKARGLSPSIPSEGAA